MSSKKLSTEHCQHVPNYFIATQFIVYVDCGFVSLYSHRSFVCRDIIILQLSLSLSSFSQVCVVVAVSIQDVVGSSDVQRWLVSAMANADHVRTRDGPRTTLWLRQPCWTGKWDSAWLVPPDFCQSCSLYSKSFMVFGCFWATNVEICGLRPLNTAYNAIDNTFVSFWFCIKTFLCRCFIRSDLPNRSPAAFISSSKVVDALSTLPPFVVFCNQSGAAPLSNNQQVSYTSYLAASQ